ncbi:MAG: hypothetical protein ABI720_05180 [Actinomycetes bacterium]
MTVQRLYLLAVVAALMAALTAGCGEANPPLSAPDGAPSADAQTESPSAVPSSATTPPDGETFELDRTAAVRQLSDAMATMKRLDAVAISIHNDQGSWDFPIPMITETYWMPATGDFHASSRADDPAGDAILEYLHVDDRDYARFQMIAEPPTKWSDVTDTQDERSGEDETDLKEQWITGLADFEPIEADQTGPTTTIHGSLPSGTAITLLGTDFAGSLPQEAYDGATAVTIVIENGLPQSLSFSGEDVDLAKVDTTNMIPGMLDGLRASTYRSEYAEGEPADSLTRPAPDEVRRVSAFS